MYKYLYATVTLIEYIEDKFQLRFTARVVIPPASLAINRSLVKIGDFPGPSPTESLDGFGLALWDFRNACSVVNH